MAHYLGLGWGPAWVLGAAVAPTDATAVGVLARALPRRTLTVLRAESLVNDGTALVIYALAVGVTVGDEHLSLPHVGWLFVLAYGGGAVAGMVTAWLAVRVRRHLHDPLQENVAVMLTPFTAFLLAEAIHASGVLAVVVSGLLMSQAAPGSGAAARQQTEAFWSLSVYLLNGSLFVLVGLELQAAVRGLGSGALARGLIAVGAVSAAVIGVRFVWLFTTPYLIRVLDRRPQQRLRRVGPRARVVSGVAGFRGAVSLAAALAVPRTVSSGAPFPDRDLIIFVTAGVIVVTLVLQALLLPVVVRWARLPARHVRRAGAPPGRDPSPPRRRWPRSRASLMISALTLRSPDGYGASTRSTCACCAPATARPRTTGAALRPAVHRAAPRRDRPQTGHAWSGCATSGASTTPSCARCRPGSTSRTYACPGANWPTSRLLTCRDGRTSA